MKEEDKNQTDKDLENDPKYVGQLLRRHEKMFAASSARYERIKDLLSRRSAKFWSSQKLEKMNKRLREALQDREYSVKVVEDIKSHMERLGMLRT